jgi:hypothetical protein
MRAPSGVLALLAVSLAVGCDTNGPFQPYRSTVVGEAGIDVELDAAYPDVLSLPTGFQPEGIAIGHGNTFYVGSLYGGAVYRGSLRTGEGEVLIPQEPGARMTVGLAFDRRSSLLFAAGGFTGAGFVYDAEAGTVEGVYPFATPGLSFVNDVVTTEHAAYFTDSFEPRLYKVPLGPAGRPSDPTQVGHVPLSGEFQSVSQCPLPGIPAAINVNGIDATPSGEHLIVVNYCLGTLYRVDPETGFAKLIDLGGATVPWGDGLLLDGQELYVAQSFPNQIAVIRLNAQMDAGVLTRVITDPGLRIPTTMGDFGSTLYVVNGRFDVAPPDQPAPSIDFEVVGIPKN